MNIEASAGIARLKNIAYFDFVGITPDMFCSYLGIFYMHGKKGYGMCNRLIKSLEVLSENKKRSFGCRKI